DRNNSLSKEEIVKQKFLPNNVNIISLGYVENIALWMKVTLTNTSAKPLKKILEYDNPSVEKLVFYDQNHTIIQGLHHLHPAQEFFNPNIALSLEAYETKTYYIKSYSRIKPTKAELILWNEVDFVKKDSEVKLFRFAFFYVMLTLLIYNFMLFTFTRDKAYFYYVFYLVSIMAYSAFFSGLLSYTFPSQALIDFLLKLNGNFIIMIPLSSLLFMQSFLETKQFPKLNKGLNSIYWILSMLIIMSYDAWMMNQWSHIISLLVGIYIIYVSFYALFSGVKQARFYVLGWTLIIIVFIFIALQSTLKYDLKNYNFSYLAEVAFVLEALLFSIALAHRIKISNEELIHFKNEEQNKLEYLVQEKTKALKVSLAEKDILYKELNHRIKNNLMMILSLLKLQIKRTQNSETSNSLIVTQNRIESIAQLYEMLLHNNQSLDVKTYPYLQSICQTISLNFSNKVSIHYEIQHNLKLDNLIYLGLIVNELVTNSFKYAFEDNKGEIYIDIKKKDNLVMVSINDTGKGFQSKRKSSLGLNIVEILVEGQLEGELDINSQNGTQVFIQWEEKAS
ncbi:MAG: Sensory transduction histidine kinase, partial [uncultured Sulfurovum sp.]